MACSADKCPICKSESLFSGYFDADDLAVPLQINDTTPEGVRWTTFCNDCGAEVGTTRTVRRTKR